MEEYLREHPEASDCGAGFRESALFQDYHGLKSFRKVKIKAVESIVCSASSLADTWLLTDE